MKFNVTSFNAEGLSAAKGDLLTQLGTDVLCLQKPHKTTAPPKIPGMHLVIFHGSRVQGSDFYIRDKTSVKSCFDHSADGLELLRVKANNITITSVYKPPPTPFKWPEDLSTDDGVHLVIGDFNSHSTNWGYSDTNKDGELGMKSGPWKGA
ncbi:Hypp9553 [Branchiostoma lanceolatum]|uniref:Hypp9553 protein n=1 Tax=Branchiostoma lanceolatum TaxID=7740 RepID=A0A8S4MNA1_BRALA|nr:Hypp9553 [Branchiostoma lanceolatum]